VKDIQNNEQRILIDVKEDYIKVQLILPLEISNSAFYDKEFEYKNLLKGKRKLVLDFSGLIGYDSYIVIFLCEIEEYCSNNSITIETLGITDELEKFITILKPKKLKNDKALNDSFLIAYFTNIGDITKTVFSDTHKLIEFIGELVKGFLRVLFKPSLMRWQDFPIQVMNVGVNAVPITVLILFLLGVISGYQGAMQLSQFGADIYLADLIGISITRELSPLMVAIIVAGRSGSAFAAEIGTMKVSEEIDALKTMGFDKMQFLVMPRVLAVSLSMPILVLICNVAGIAGGLIAGLASLDITITSFLTQLNVALSYWDVLSGVAKSIVFGVLIAAIGCFRGFQVSGGAEGVGKYTTASVVSSIFLIILVDALFVFLLQALGI